MKIGICGGVDKAPIVKALGLDYIEENMSKLLPLTDREFSDLQKTYEKLDLPVYSFNVFFGAGIPLYSDEFYASAKEYCKTAFERASALGGEICVIGSGKARKIPEGMSYSDAEDRFVDILKIIGEEGARLGIRLAVEPLNRDETNFINTVGDAARIARRAELENVSALVDFYHFNRENESDEALLTVGNSIIHTHIAAPRSRKMMPQNEDMPTVTHWAELLKKINFNTAISIEARYENFEQDLREGLQYLAPFKAL
jgi:sugar phosphate isomerase/epimerase